MKNTPPQSSKLKNKDTTILSVKNITTGYGKKQVLFDLSLQLKQAETVLLVGSNGSGKSTLFKAIYGVLPLWNGTIDFEQKPLHNSKTTTPSSKLIAKGLMYLPQKDELFADMTVIENLKMSMLHLKSPNQQNQRLSELLELIPSLKLKSKQQADRLSGGERKKLSLGMALLNRPKLLLFDEPLAGLSDKNANKVLEFLTTIKQNGTTLVLIEHRIKNLIHFADRTIGLKLGQLHPNNLKTINEIKTFLV